MRLEQVRERCERLLSDMNVPVPFSMSQFCQRLGEQRGRPITLVPLTTTEVALASGAWVELADRDVILYDTTTTGFHQQLIVAHEVGHLVCDHYPNSVLPPDVARHLLPSLDPALVRRILSRTDYSNQEEQEAEMFATLLLRHADRQSDRPTQGPQAAAVLSQLGSTFEE